VTIYNYAIAPPRDVYGYPNDPDITLKASQTVYPLSRNFCLILTNLEYAKDSSTNPLEKRTFARHFRDSMVRTDAFIRKRKLSNIEVATINSLLKTRARRYIAAGKGEWLYPESLVADPSKDLREILMPKDDLWRFGGELCAKFNDGRVYYQNQFGQKEQKRPFLQKDTADQKLRPREACGCGSGKRFKACCMAKPEALRGHSEAWKLSGLTQSEYCKRHNISLKNFGNWRAQLKRVALGGPSARWGHYPRLRKTVKTHRHD
jgi:hypothetical protein